MQRTLTQEEAIDLYNKYDFDFYFDSYTEGIFKFVGDCDEIYVEAEIRDLPYVDTADFVKFDIDELLYSNEYLCIECKSTGSKFEKWGGEGS